MSKVQIVNLESDRKWLDVDVLDSDGTLKRNAAGQPVRERVLLGSSEDRGVVDSAQPELEMDGAKWDRLVEHPAVRGWIESRQIAVYPLAA